MIVYVIEKGYYSDRYIIGVTDSKETAEIIKNQYNQNGDTTYTEYNTEQFKVIKPMRYSIGFICKSNRWYGFPDEFGSKEEYDSSVYLGKSEDWSGDEIESYVVLANSLKQAIKIAQDMRAERCAEENGLI